MSEGITHTAVVDDCARLMLYDASICDAFKSAIGGYLNMARLGGITRHGDRHNVSLLARMRTGWPGDDDGLLARKLAFVLGWMSHRAADRTMKKIFRDLDGDCPQSPRDCSVYNDACVLREVYDGGDPFAFVADPEGLQAHPAAGESRIAAAEDLFTAMWRRMLVRMHTFIPDDDDIDTWLDRVARTQQRLYVDLRRYAEAYVSPDPDKWRRFIVEPNFYDRSDPLIRLVRSLQRGEGDAGVSLSDACAGSGAGSLYAKMLGRAFSYCSAASEFFMDRISEEEISSRLEIGRPELSG